MTDNPADTQPKSPTGLIEAIQNGHLEETGPHRSVSYPAVPLYQTESGCLRTLLVLAVLGISICLCFVIVTLAGFAGIRDEMEAIGTSAVQVQQTDVADQYQRGVADLESGRYELAGDRFAYVLTEIPDYEDASALLQQVMDVLNYTPTPSETPTSEPTETPTSAPPPQRHSLKPPHGAGQAPKGYTPMPKPQCSSATTKRPLAGWTH